MALIAYCRPYAYLKIPFEDPDEAQHRRAQFLIHKILQEADRRSTNRRPWWRVRVFKLKIKIGRRFNKMRKGFSNVVMAKPLFCRQISCVVKSCKYLIATGKTQSVGAGDTTL